MNDEYNIKAVVLAAGIGTRLQPLTYAIPKEMIHVCGKPLVQHAIELLRHATKNIIVIVGEKKGALMDFLKDGRWLDVDISYRFQEERTGNAAALYTAKPLIDGTFFAMYGDEIIEPKDSVAREMISLHRTSKAACTVGVSTVDDPKRYGVVKFSDDRINEMMEKPQTPQDLERLEVNGKHYGSNGLFVFEPVVFEYIEKLRPGRNEELWIADAVRNMILDGKKCVAHVHEGIYRDVGTFEALLEVERELLNRMI
ncbi:MAG: NTP transferase domain-containing protein [Candidatus Aenigmarchaeota archaeon]|nr:NTP transferase domain-containing protein [Candidatus Aenigmarchaeota archaeon]